MTSSAVSRAPGAGDADRANVLAVHALWIGIIVGGTLLAHWDSPAWMFLPCSYSGA